jgi:hypothetical protein
MKYSLFVLSVIVATYSFPKITYANPADALVTKPATIDNWYVFTGEQKNRSTSVYRQQCKNSGILNYIKNPDAFFQACPDAGKKLPPSYEPVGETKIPHLDSGVSVTVTKF